jgi:hypothetical protein
MQTNHNLKEAIMTAINTTLNSYTPLASNSGSGYGAGNASLERDAVLRAVSASNAVAATPGSEAVLLDLSPAAQEYLKGLMQQKAAEEVESSSAEVAPVGNSAES